MFVKQTKNIIYRKWNQAKNQAQITWGCPFNKEKVDMLKIKVSTLRRIKRSNFKFQINEFKGLHDQSHHGCWFC